MDPLWAGATPSGPRRPLLGLGNPFWAWEIPSGVARAQKGHVSPEGVARAQTGSHSPAKHPLMAKNLLSEYLPSDHSNHFTHQASRELRKRKKPVCEAGQWPRHTMGPKRSNRRIGGKKSLTHSPARSAALRSPALRSALCSTPLCSAPLRATPLAGSFVSEKVAMY